MKRFLVSVSLAAILVPSLALAQKSVRPTKARPARTAKSSRTSEPSKRPSKASPTLHTKVAASKSAPGRPPTSAEIRAEATAVSARIDSLVSEKSSLLVRMQQAESQRGRAMKSGDHGAMTHASRHLASLEQQLDAVNRNIVKANVELSELSRQLNASLIFERGVAADAK